jgi:hypothetical protein
MKVSPAEALMEKGISNAINLHLRELDQRLSSARSNLRALAAENNIVLQEEEKMSDDFKGLWRFFFRTSDKVGDGVRTVVGELEIDPEAAGKINGRHKKAAKDVEIDNCKVKSIGGDIIVSFSINDPDDNLTYYYRGRVTSPLMPRKVEGEYFAFKNDGPAAGAVTNLLIAAEPGDTGGWGGNQGT